VGVYNTKGTGIYIDHGGDKMGMRIENNEWSTGEALWIDNCNTGTALNISDLSTGRIIHTSQDLPDKPAVTIVYRASLTGIPDDSSMCYWWGFKGRKAEVETVKTMLCGKRTFGNNGKNLCDTIIVTGAAENTTVATASYSEGFEAATCTALRIKVAPDTIIIKRGYTTDPVQYYWQAQKIIDKAQIQMTPEISSSRPEKSSPAPGLPAAVTLQQSYPNPAVAEANISYQVSGEGKVSLALYNMLGQKVKTLVDQWQPAGSYTVNWNGSNQKGQKCSAGIYIYKLNTGQSELTRKLVLAR